MSSTLMWQPIREPGGCLPDELKKVISRRLWGTDGSCGIGVAPVDRSDISYLEGLRDGGVKGADELIKLIRKHDKIQLWHDH